MPTPTINNRLIIIRDSITEAKQLLSDRSQDFDRMKALWFTDLAVDMMLATVISHLNLPLKSKKPMFDDLEKTIFDSQDARLSGLRPHRVLINTLHNQRNGVQHQGISPSLQTARDCVYGAENFLRDAFKVFGLELNTFSLSDFIAFEEAKKYLKEAEKYFTNNDYTESAWMATQAFEQGKREFYKTVRGESESSFLRPYSWSHSVKEKGRHPGDIYSYNGNENPAITEIAEVLELTRFGLDLHRVILFVQAVPEVYQPLGSDVWVRAGEHRTFSIDEAKFILDFSIDALYRMQSFVSSYWVSK